jgi:hypothetical protein
MLQHLDHDRPGTDTAAWQPPPPSEVVSSQPETGDLDDMASGKASIRQGSSASEVLSCRSCQE